MQNRNKIEYQGWILEKVSDPTILQDFECGDDDLNDYYRNDSENHRKQFLTQTYCFHRIDHSWEDSLAFVDICNDSLKIENLPQDLMSSIPEGKSYPFYPAIKVTRLGVSAEAKGQGIGTKLLNAVKHLFITDNRTGCRFITVDAYNSEKVLNFYKEHNGFEELKFRSSRENRRTIPLVFDLARISIIEENN